MALVPYVFANQSGPIPLSELDANFSNVKLQVNNASNVTNNVQANITSVGTLTSLSVSGNVTSGNLIFGNNIISGTGNILAANMFGNVRFGSGSVSGAGNITGGNLTITKDALVVGNLTVQGTTFTVNSNTITTNDLTITVGNNQSSGIALDGAGLLVGSSNLATFLFDNTTSSWQSNIGLTPASNGVVNLGGAVNYWNEAYINSASVIGNISSGNITVAGNVVAGANISGGNLRTTGQISAAGNITGGNILTGGAIRTSSILSVAGNITAGNISTSGALSVTGTVNFSNGASITNLVASNIQITSGNIVSINPLSVNNGGTGTGFFTTNELLAGNATGELKTIAPGSNGNFLTSTGTEWLSTSPVFLGKNQTWQNLASSRSVGVVYTNTSGGPIQIIVTLVNTGGAWLYLDSNLVIRQFYDVNTGAGQVGYSFVSAVIPNGGTYQVVAGNLYTWWELRA